MIDIFQINDSIDDMKNEDSKRPYKMSKRAETAAQTASDIFVATADLWRERSIADITLDVIAARANVSVRTIIRRYGSKEGLFEACIQNNAADMKSDREKAEVGNVESIIRYLLEDYEMHGDAVIRTLAMEDQLDIARRVLEAGRIYHREWCERMFSPFLPDKKDMSYERELMAFSAATELYLWKLLRRDLKHSLDETQSLFLRLVNGLIASDGKGS